MTTAHVDVLIVGAGLSGIGAGVHLKQRCPNRSFILLEGRQNLGGTWDLFRYPGIRSDSDMHTMGYAFKPWLNPKAIADGPAILDYIKETAAEYDIEQYVRYQHLVRRANWSSQQAVWTVEAERSDTGETVVYTCSILYLCSGYYSYRGGYKPDFPGQERFDGPLIHPQEWPDDLDYNGKRVVVIGSGATAITLIPAMTARAAHVTMLQRSPTYLFSWPDKDIIANTLNKLLPAKMAYGITRQKNIAMQQYFYWFTQRYPQRSRTGLLKKVRRQLGPDYPLEPHFTPSYMPWQQRLCLCPNGDFLAALKTGTASVVTDQIESLTRKGISLKSGETLDADIIVTATGINLVVFGEVAFSVDGQPVDFSKTWTYKGLAVSDVPNLFSCFGYINASWTLGADLTSEFVCRVLNHMDHTATRQCTPRLRPSDRNMPGKHWIEGFNPGYIRRAMHLFPKQSDRDPWQNTQNYKLDKALMRKAPIDDGVLIFTSPGEEASQVQ
jgi:cation diffusion facilitator CzcD-associated flavoprotein CzcO